MEIDIFQVDAFVEPVFKGNPAAVCSLYPYHLKMTDSAGV